jgi:hypothetical protein
MFHTPSILTARFLKIMRRPVVNKTLQFHGKLLFFVTLFPRYYNKQQNGIKMENCSAKR